MQSNNQEPDVEFSNKEIDDMIASINTVDDIIGVYDTDELMLVPENELDESAIELNEILSRSGRIKAKAKLRRNEVKLQRSKKIVLKRRSNNATLIKRARRLAIKMMKEKLSKKKLSGMSVNDKMRTEAIVLRRKATIDKIAKRLLPRMRKIEQDRLTHKKYTK